MTRAILFAVLLLTGCATATKAGKPGQYLVECNGAAVPLSKCYTKASEVCPNGYDVVERERTNGATTGAYANGVATLGAPEYKNLLVQCK